MRVIALWILIASECALGGVFVDRTLSNSFASKDIGPSVSSLSPLLVAKSLPPMPSQSLGNYPDTSVPLSTDTTVTPEAAPTNTISINVSTSTHFKGRLEGNPTTGVVRVTDAHPAGAYTVTVRDFDSGGE